MPIIASVVLKVGWMIPCQKLNVKEYVFHIDLDRYSDFEKDLEEVLRQYDLEPRE